MRQPTNRSVKGHIVVAGRRDDKRTRPGAAQSNKMYSVVFLFGYVLARHHGSVRLSGPFTVKHPLHRRNSENRTKVNRHARHQGWQCVVPLAPSLPPVPPSRGEISVTIDSKPLWHLVLRAEHSTESLCQVKTVLTTAASLMLHRDALKQWGLSVGSNNRTRQQASVHKSHPLFAPRDARERRSQ